MVLSPETYDKLNPGSPFFPGVRCKECGNVTKDPDFDDLCPNCQKKHCPCCEEDKPAKGFRPIDGVLICGDCFTYITEI